MADFARMAIACETALWPRGTFEKAYSNNREETVDAGTDADPVAAAVRALVARQRTVRTVRTANQQDPIGTVWAGTTSDLLGELETVKDEIGHRRAGWPKSSPALSDRLTRAKPFLRRRGIEIIRDRVGHDRRRMIYITHEERTEGRLYASSSTPIHTGLAEEDEVYDEE
jgi:hypothetical protein